MHFLLTNDDGIEAPGLAALAEAVRLFSPDATFTIVAPAEEQSQCGHWITTYEPLALQKRAEHIYSVSGSPADCVRVALFHLGLKPDFVLSGINAGGNMGQDLPISGTMAAAREAAYHGFPALAFSHYLVKDRKLDWDRASKWTAEIIESLLKHPQRKGQYWSINLPHLPEDEQDLPPIVDTKPASSPLPVSYSCEKSEGETQWLLYGGRYSDRARDLESDVEACFGGSVSVCTLQI